MSDDRQPSSMPTTTPTPRRTQSSQFEDISLHGVSTSELANRATPKDYPANMQANVERVTGLQEVAKSILHANDVPFVRTPSSISHHSLTLESNPPKRSHNDIRWNVDSSKDPATDNNLPLRKDSSSQTSDLLQKSYLERSHNSDTGRDSNLNTRKDSDAPPDTMHTSTQLPFYPREEHKSAYTGKGLPLLNTTILYEGSIHHSSQDRPSVTTPQDAQTRAEGSHLPPESRYTHTPLASSPIYYSPRIPLEPLPIAASRRSASLSDIVAPVPIAPGIQSSDQAVLPDTGSFADNNPYRFQQSRQKRPPPDSRRSNSGPTPVPVPVPLIPNQLNVPQNKQASSILIPERKRTQPFTKNKLYRRPGIRRNTSPPILETPNFSDGFFADHNPYHLPLRKTTFDLLDLDPTPQPRPSLAPSSDPSGDRQSPFPDFPQPSGDRQSPLPDFPQPSGKRRRRRRRSRSSLEHRTAMNQSPGYLTPLSSFESVPLESRHHNSQRSGFWSGGSAFFKSPYDARSTDFINDNFKVWRPRKIEEPSTLFIILKVIVGQAYFHILLRLPSLYFSRVCRIIDTTHLTLYEIVEMVFATSEGLELEQQAQATPMYLQAHESIAPQVRPQYERLKNSWESFIDSLIREWETFNVVSVMLLTAILTILQITPAASDPITRYAALFSLICSLVSLLFGCLYIIRFGTMMRKPYAAAEYAKAVLLSSQSVIWNMWVLLSMPAVWLTWSIILFIVAIMSFVWRTNPASNDASTFILSSTSLLIVRIAISALLGVGLVDMVFITNTFQLYGQLDRDWQKWLKEWQNAKKMLTPGTTPYLDSVYPRTSFPIPHRLPSVVDPIVPPYMGLTEHRSTRRRRSSASSSDTNSSVRSSQRRSRSPSGSLGHIHTQPSSKYSESSSRRSMQSEASRRTPPIVEHTKIPSIIASPIIPMYHSSSLANVDETQNSRDSPEAPIAKPDRWSISSFNPLGNEAEENDWQSRVRFRSPVVSEQGSMDWDV